MTTRVVLEPASSCKPLLANFFPNCGSRALPKQEDSPAWYEPQYAEGKHSDYVNAFLRRGRRCTNPIRQVDRLG